MTEGNKPNQNKKPLNPEILLDDVIVDGWRRRADGTFEKVKEVEEFEEVEKNEQNLDDSKEDS
jgi:hypothetical protein